MFSQLQRAAKGILKEVVELVYFMRGSIQYDNMLQMTFAERQVVADFVESRLDVEKKKNPTQVY